MPNSPWWISDHKVVTAQDIKKRNTRTVSFGIAIAMALIAGVVGSIVGRTSATLDTRTNLVSTQSTIERKPDSIAGIAARVSPSVVSIEVSRGNSGGTGSGFFLDSTGHILTNNHVISLAARAGALINVKLANGKNYEAKLVGRDIPYDLAVIKINVTDAPALQLGNSDEVQVGDGVIAIGVVIQGETKHFDYVCSGTTNGIMEVMLKYNKPVAFCVLTDNNIQQSIDRSGGIHGNKGTEAAIACLKMIANKQRFIK